MKIRSNLAVSENGFVFDPKTGESFTVNKVGVKIINQLKKTSDINEVIKNIETEYEVDHYTLEKSMNDFIIMMQEFNLLENE